MLSPLQQGARGLLHNSMLTPIAAANAANPAKEAGNRTLALLPVSVPIFGSSGDRSPCRRPSPADQRQRRVGRATVRRDHTSAVSRPWRAARARWLCRDRKRTTTPGRRRTLAKDRCVRVAPRWKRDSRRALDDSNDHRNRAATYFQAVYSEPYSSSCKPNVAAEVAALIRGLERLAVDVASSIRRVRIAASQ